jgi:hypothetical protein
MPLSLFDWTHLAALAAMLLAAMWHDTATRRIPNTLVLWGSLTAIGLSLSPHGIGLGSALAGGLVSAAGRPMAVRMLAAAQQARVTEPAQQQMAAAQMQPALVAAGRPQPAAPLVAAAAAQLAQGLEQLPQGLGPPPAVGWVGQQLEVLVLLPGPLQAPWQAPLQGLLQGPLQAPAQLLLVPGLLPRALLLLMEPGPQPRVPGLLQQAPGLLPRARGLHQHHKQGRAQGRRHWLPLEAQPQALAQLRHQSPPQGRGQERGPQTAIHPPSHRGQEQGQRPPLASVLHGSEVRARQCNECAREAVVAQHRSSSNQGCSAHVQGR